MTTGQVVGLVAGLFVAHLIAAARSRFTYLGGGYGSFEGMSCVATLLLYLVGGALGTVIGGLLFP